MHQIANIIPLFWVKGESDRILLDGLKKLRDAGIMECIIEARPYPKWLEKKWFDTLRTLFDEARRTNMRLWLFDDCHFPSGGAGGRITQPHRKMLLRCQTVELNGPGRYSILYPTAEDESIFKAILAPYAAPDGFDGASARELPLQEGASSLEVMVPQGRHRIFFLIRTHEFGEEHTRTWVNMLSSEAVREFITISYEAHYRELKEYFEQGVMAGFFSDEPRFGSAPNYDSLPDGKSRSLPFSDELGAMLSSEPAAFWPALWHECGSDTPKYRTHFMNAVSSCYSRAFSQQIGDWCRSHGVAYIGHTIEDNGAHARLGYGIGHYFRTMDGQDIAAVDSVLHQNLTGITEGIHETSFGRYDSSFYHWGLAKLAASAAHLMPQFNGRAACECFGANGWSFGLEQMKIFTDHLIVRGINCLLPHAFSNAPFPDADCPPHFYARGNNPQWPYFHLWREYADRLCRMLQGGIHLSGTAILYHAEAEWSTRPFTPYHSLGEILMKHQLDYDVIPFDLLKDARIEHGTMTINGEEFKQLAIPDYTYLEPDKRAILEQLQANGLHLCDAGSIVESARSTAAYPVASDTGSLRVYRYKIENEVRLFLVNESLTQSAHFHLPPGGSHWYDALTDRCFIWHDECTLAPGETLFAIYGINSDDAAMSEFPQGSFRILDTIACKRDAAGFWHCSIPEELLGNPLFLDCGEPEGVAELQWNGNALPPRIAPPYRFDITALASSQNIFSLKVIPTVNPGLGGIFDRAIPRRLNSLAAPRLLIFLNP